MDIFALIKPLLFKLDPEFVHDEAMHFMQIAPWAARLLGETPSHLLKVNVGNNLWDSPIGLAAGFDKNAKAFNFLSGLGFGHIELGTVTLKAQLGNPRPRIFRHVQDKSLRNALGFPSLGLKDFKETLSRKTAIQPYSINIGKNKDTSATQSIDEYLLLFKELAPLTSQLTINISSPNTPGLRDLDLTWLENLLKKIQLERKKENLDLYLKISPDADEKLNESWLKLSEKYELTGIIATNTTTQHSWGIGGVSGQYLKPISNPVWEKLLILKDPKFEIIAVGGFASFMDILNVWEKGGKAIQLYTSFIFQGPQMLNEMNKNMLHFLKSQNLKSLNDFFSQDLSVRKELVRTYKTRLIETAS